MVHRAIGVALIGVGAALFKFFALDVLRKFDNGEHVTYYKKLIVLAGLLPVVGLVFAVLGERGVEMMRIDRSKLTWQQVAVLLVGAGSGLALLVWFEGRLGV